MTSTATHRSVRPPLEGIRVLDLTIAMAGPLCTQRLGEMGADVLKIEAPGGGDFARHAPMAGVTRFGDATCYLTLNRNKRSLVLNLKQAAGQEVLYELVKTADVLVQNYRPRVAKKLGIDYPTLAALNPALVYASISGYGEEGPMKDRPGQDLLVQCFTGLTMNGGVAAGLPHPSPLYMVDVSASHVACEGVLAGLVARSSTGRGQEVKLSLMSAIMEMQCQEITSWHAADAPPQRGAAPQVSIWMEPPYGIYACKTGHLAIAQASLTILAEELELPLLGELEHQRPAQGQGDAVAQWRDRICLAVANRLVDADAGHWDERLNAAGVWCLVVNDYSRFLNHPQARAHLVTMQHPTGGEYTTVAPAMRFSDNPEPELRTAPAYGKDTRDILIEAGFTAGRIDTLIADGAVVAA